MPAELELAHDELGSGPCVVLIHGHPFDRSLWRPQVDRLVHRFRVIAPDLRGFGATPATPHLVTLRQYADDVERLLDRLGVGRAAVVGLSMGGLVAMDLVTTHPERWWSLGLVATTAAPPTAEERAARRARADQIERDGLAPLIEYMHSGLYGPRASRELRRRVDAMMARAPAAGAAAALRGRAERPDYRPRLRELDIPAFVCAGAADPWSDAAVTNEIVAHLRRPELLVIDEAGHLPNLEAEELFSSRLLTFLAENAPRHATPAPHEARRAAESFGTDPERYDRTRPRYPSALIERIVTSMPGRDVLDVGIGTGVSAQPFRAAGCRVLGVEVDPRMAAFARKRGRFIVDTAKFEEWDPAGRMFDAVIAGMTWHWIDPRAGAVKAAEVLRPDGLLAVFWNVHLPPLELARAFADIYRRVLPGTPFAAASRDAVESYGQILDRVSGGIADARAFSEPERLRFDWERSYTSEEWQDQVPTFGGHGTIEPEKLDQLLSMMKAATDRYGGSFKMQYATLALTARRTSEPAGGA